MPLTQFTISDRDIIVTVLALPSSELEEGSRLYKELETIEDRDRRIPGLNRVSKLKILLTDIDSLVQNIEDTIETNAESIAEDYGVKRVTVDREYTVEYANSDGNTGAVGLLNKRLTDKLETLRSFLNMPWQDEAAIGFPLLWA